MNVIFLLGNGFDINLGMKTSYGDFYRFYIDQYSSGGEVIETLKKNINANTKKWSDLEYTLGEYTSYLNTSSEVDTIIFDLARELRKYLIEEEKRFNFSTLDQNKFFEDLISPETYLSQRDQQDIRLFSQRWKNDVSIQILSFNYTKTVENIIESQASNLNIGKKGNANAILKGVEHIHGYINNRLILGVNDVGQIQNEGFKENQEVLELLIKPNYNQAIGHLRDEYCINQISNANLIYIFGSSIGKTDKLWWETIGESLGDTCRLVIFYRGQQIEENQEILDVRKGRDMVKSFLSMTSLSDEDKDIAKKYIYFGASKDLFKLSRIE